MVGTPKHILVVNKLEKAKKKMNFLPLYCLAPAADVASLAAAHSPEPGNFWWPLSAGAPPPLPAPAPRPPYKTPQPHPLLPAAAPPPPPATMQMQTLTLRAGPSARRSTPPPASSAHLAASGRCLLRASSSLRRRRTRSLRASASLEQVKEVAGSPAPSGKRTNSSFLFLIYQFHERYCTISEQHRG